MNFSSGLSGCKIELLDNKVVRKYSSSLDYNSRLILQIDKQNLFSNLIFKNITTPKVLNVTRDNLYYFDMEYIPGKSFYDYFSVASNSNIKFVLETIFEYFDTLIDNYKTVNVQTNILKKIKSLKEKTLLNEYLNYLENYVTKNKIIIPKTFCHGDLTFNNIIFHKKRLFFIDFLDSYIDSFLCDLIKLKQDLFYLWGLTIENKKSIRVYQIYSYIWEKIEQRYFEYINNINFDILDALNLLRLEPYLTNDYQRSILNEIIKTTKLYEKFNNTNGGEI
jgi:thiamine kinase-like enzyme